ncbi:MAG: phytanoyl-CoA dioxygenase family protein [Gammaproteobacteria bacterium]|nr:phytanoyl-CoA dioxygenase family protein [Gammaproteobacteria bacterium]
MEIGDWKSTGSVAPLYKELAQLDLLSNITELEAFGFTVVPPEKVGPPEFCEEVKAALERTMLRRYGDDGLSEERWSNVNDIQRFMLWEDEIFEKLTYNPAGLGLAQWMLGTDCILSLCAAWVKGPGEVRTGIHGDYLDPALQAQPEQINNCNMHFMLTDYTKDDGSISFVPGSHKWRRQVTPDDSKYWADRAVAVEAPKGSMVIWGNHTWHGSYPKKTSGLRMTLQCEYMRRRRQAEEAYRETVTQDALDRNPIRFAGLMDVYSLFPFGASDWDIERVSKAEPGSKSGQTMESYRSLFDTEPANGKTTLRPKYDYMRHDGVMTSQRNASRIRREQKAAEEQERAEAPKETATAK